MAAASAPTGTPTSTVPGAGDAWRPGRWSDAGLRRLAVVLVGVAVLTAVAAAVVHLVAEPRAALDGFPTLSRASLVFGTAWPLAGLAVLHNDARNRVGWLLVASGAIGPYQLLGEYSIWNHYVSPLPGSALSDWTSMWGFTVYFLVLPLVPMLFPDGRLPSRRWRPLALVIVGAAASATLARMLVPGPSDIDLAITNPVDIEQLWILNTFTLVAALACNAVGVPAGIAATVVRMRRTVGTERAQLQWLALGGLALLAGLTASLLTGRGQNLFFDLGLLGPPLGIAVAALRHRLLDVDLVLNRSLVFLVVLVVTVGSGAWLLFVLDPDVTGTRAGVLLVAALAVVVVAVRGVVQHHIDRRFYPERQASAQIGRRIAETVSATADPRDALEQLVAAARSTLRLPYVGFVRDDGVVLAGAGERPERVLQVDGTALGRQVGVLELAARREGEGVERRARLVVEQVAAQAAMLAYAATLVSDVAESRTSIVRAREEERRRLRNDLHDGVGPTLAAIALQADALARRVDDGHREAAAGIRDRLREAVAQVRAVSHGLRPPVLDQIGLPLALRGLVDGLAPLSASADVEDLDDVPAAAEVVAYTVAAEAVANAVKHSAASTLRLRATTADGVLVVWVADNGRGMPARPSAGVGLTSMHQRATELGGRLRHETTPGGGTTVVLTVPLDPQDGRTP